MEEDKNILDYIKVKEQNEENNQFLGSYFDNFSNQLISKLKEEDRQNKSKKSRSKIIYFSFSIAASVGLIFVISYFLPSSSDTKMDHLISKKEKDLHDFKLKDLSDEIVEVDTLKRLKKEDKITLDSVNKSQITKEEKSFDELLMELEDEDLIFYLTSNEIEIEDLDI
jgi:hypothetical protein